MPLGPVAAILARLSRTTTGPASPRAANPRTRDYRIFGPDEVPLRAIRSLRRAHLSAVVTRQQGERGGFRQALRARQRHARVAGFAAPLPWRRRFHGGRGGDAGRVRCAARHSLGPRRARHQDRPRADPDRPDGTRLRVSAGDQRRRGRSTTSSSRSRDRRRKKSTRRSGPAASAWPRRRAGC